MRLSTILSISLLATALAGCGDASSNLDLGSGTKNLCGLFCPEEALQQQTADSRGNPKDNTGNNTSLSDASADDTIVLKKSVIANFDESNPALSKLTRTSSSAIYDLDPNTSDQSSWPKAKALQYYRGGTSLGANYKEYRILTRTEAGVGLDEELQVWKWKNSYGVQYRHSKSGGDADHQAWSFGGTRTAAAKVPTSGSSTYTGTFAATAKTFNWDDTPIPGQTIARNNLWRLAGTSSTNVNFGSGKVTSSLTPTTWNAYQTLGGATGFKDVTVGQGSANEFDFMNDQVKLSGKLTKTAGAATGKANSIKGTSKLKAVGATGGLSAPVTGDKTNLFRGALFGPNADEFAGIFNLEATYPAPVGGDIPINDDRRAFMNMSGVVNGSR